MNDKNIGVRYYHNYGYLVEGILCIYGCGDTLFLKTKDAIKPEHIADLRGFMQSLKDKEVSPEDLFKPEIDKNKAAEVADKFADFEEISDKKEKVDKKTGEILAYKK